MDQQVRRNDERSRYELLRDGQVVGVADYRESGDQVVMPHTVIDPSLRGQGLGDVLVRAALDDLRGSGRAVVPTCWFVAEFIEGHPEYRDLLEARGGAPR
jgi:predicted GNAT family acetyltransferase